jgi:hypothetical protein
VRYRFYDLILDSNCELPELYEVRVSGDDAARARTIVIERAAARLDDLDGVWFHEWRLPDGDPWLAAARLTSGGYLLRVSDLAAFQVDAAGARVRVFAEAHTSGATLRHLLLDQVLPLVVSHRGELVLHASAAKVDSGAVLFVARGGSGKSTLAAALGARGAPVVGDDAITLRAHGSGLVALGAYPGLRLWSADHTDKRRVGPGTSSMRFESEPTPVAAIYVLDPSVNGPIGIMALASRDAVIALVANAYVLDVGDRGRLARQLDLAILSGRAVPVRRLAYPHDTDRLGELCSALAADV